MKTVAYLLQSKLFICASFISYCSFSCSLSYNGLKFSVFQLAWGASSGDKEGFTGRTSLSKDETETYTRRRIMFDV